MRRKAGFIFVLPSFIGVLMFNLLPFGDVIRRSFMTAVGSEIVGLQNYVNIFQNEAYQLAVKNTLWFMGIGMPLLFVMSLAVAVVLVEVGRKVHTFKSIFLLPMALPVASIVFVWQMLFHNSGLINGGLSQLGIANVNWLDSSKAFGILILSYVWKNLGYNIILWSAGLVCIPINCYEAARVDGASGWQCFVKITLPGLKPSMYTIGILSLLNAFKIFREAYLVAGNYPDESIYMLQHLMNNWFRDLAIDKMSAAAVVNVIVIVLFTIILKKIWLVEE